MQMVFRQNRRGQEEEEQRQKESSGRRTCRVHAGVAAERRGVVHLKQQRAGLPVQYNIKAQDLEARRPIIIYLAAVQALVHMGQGGLRGEQCLHDELLDARPNGPRVHAASR